MFNVLNGVEVTTSKASCEYIRKKSREFPTMSIVSTQSTPRSVRSYHRGNGNLRGGGVQKIYSKGPVDENLRKLDNRLGVCIFSCLGTLATILIIYGMFHETAHEQLSAYITSTKEILIASLPSSTTTTANTEIIIERLLVTDNESEMYSTSPLLEPDTCFGSEDVDQTKCLTIAELQHDFDLLHGSHIVLWNLVALNVIIAALLLPCICLFCSDRMQKNSNYKLFYRAILFLALFFMAMQLIFLISPLFSSANYYPSMVDKLLIYKLPRERHLINSVESRFGCQFDFIPQLVELSIQEPCLPKIKNSLLPTYAVLLLIIIDLLPFAFIIFTYAWDAWIKDTAICSGARRRIELNNQQRDHNHEKIF
uniref:Uncharacterized protein n=1 Tax=Ascaris lumbricoides TaxID=6252 RepID=A0A9J2NZP0_ASCLU